MIDYTPESAWQRLVEGNARFVADRPEHPNQDALRRKRLVDGQRPYATVFGCSDSRVAIETAFDAGLGELFVMRNAGHVLGTSILGSLEYAVGSLGVPHVVVLAHEHCGAVQAAYDAATTHQKPEGFFVRDLIERIDPAIEAARRDGDGSIEAVAQAHLEHTVMKLTARSELLADAVARGTIAIVGARYELATGAVREIMRTDAAHAAS